MKRILFLSILAVANQGLYAQNVVTQTIRWNVTQTQEINTGRVTDNADRIVSYGTSKIEWQDPAGVVKHTFTISETNGSWPNVQSNGAMLYEVSEGERVGTLRIFRTSSELTIRITLLKGDEDPDLYEFSIANLETL